MISLRKGCSALLAAAVLLTGACDSKEITTAPLDPATLSVVGSNAVEAPANFPAPQLIRVRLTTKDGRPVSGRVVKFTAAAGATLSADSSFTDENGEAAVGVKVGDVGSYTVTATSPGVAPVTFTATAVPIAPALLLAGPGNNQSGLANEPLQPISALVLNNDGTPAAGVPVTFTVTSGGGSVSPGTVTTNANGLATTTFTIGSTGTQTVAVTSPGLTSATFTAAIANACLAARGLTIPQTLSRSLGAEDCKLATNRFIEFFDVNVTAPFTISESSTAFIPSMVIRNSAGDTVAFHTPAASPAAVKAFLVAGTYRVGASTSAANATGAYTLTTAGSVTEVSGCERTYVTKGVTITGQNIAATDCSRTFDDQNGFGAQLHYGDEYRIFLTAGTVMTITQSGAADHLIRVTNLATGLVTQRDNFIKGVTEVLAYTAPSTGQYIILASAFNNNAGGVPPDTGPYTLQIQ